MNIKTGMGKGLTLRAERNREKATDWDVFVDQSEPPQGGLPSVQCGVFRCHDGKGLMMHPSPRETVSVLLRADIDPDMFKSSTYRLLRQVCSWTEVELVHAL